MPLISLMPVPPLANINGKVYSRVEHCILRGIAATYLRGGGRFYVKSIPELNGERVIKIDLYLS